MAAAIKLFTFNRKYCHVVGLYPLDLNQTGPSLNSRNWMIIINIGIFFLTSTAFLFSEAKSMLEIGFSLGNTLVALLLLCMYLTIIWQMKNTWPFIEKCEQFIEKRENSIKVYRELTKKIDILCEVVAKGLTALPQSIQLSFLLYSLINYYILDWGEESFLMLSPTTLPFDWKTPLGYLVAWLIQSAGSIACSLMSVIIINLFLGPCWLFIVMAKDITKDLAAFNKDVEVNANRSEWMKRFCDIIQLYSDAKECVEKFNTIIKYAAFFYITLLMFYVTVMLVTFEIQLADDNAKLIETLPLPVWSLWVFGVLFFICEIGQRVTYHFDRFRKELERCDWLALPIEMQRMYMLFLSDTQQEKNITCFANIVLNRETFKMTTNTAWSYFMSIRQIKV